MPGTSILLPGIKRGDLKHSLWRIGGMGQSVEDMAVPRGKGSADEEGEKQVHGGGVSQGAPQAIHLATRRTRKMKWKQESCHPAHIGKLARIEMAFAQLC